MALNSPLPNRNPLPIIKTERAHATSSNRFVSFML
jgi:hypothetical protein